MLHESYIQGGEAFHNDLKGNAILQLQRVKVNKTNQKKEKSLSANVLWDNGSTVTFITFEQADKMKLVGKQSELFLKRMGDKVGERITSVKYIFYITNLKGGRTKLEAFGIERITSEICKINSNKLKRMFKKSDIGKNYNRPENGAVDLLIGSDYLGLHPARHKALGNLLLMKNSYGTIIAGRHADVHEGTQKLVNHAEVFHISRGFTDFYSQERLGTNIIQMKESLKLHIPLIKIQTTYQIIER